MTKIGDCSPVIDRFGDKEENIDEEDDSKHAEKTESKLQARPAREGVIEIVENGEVC